jgi:hypothetical protein
MARHCFFCSDSASAFCSAANRSLYLFAVLLVAAAVATAQAIACVKSLSTSSLFAFLPVSI